MIPIGWLSPDGKLIKCNYMDHWQTSEGIAKEAGAPDGVLYDDYLLNRGWVHLTMTTYLEHGWAVIFPYNTYGLTQEQHDFLKPYVEDNIDFLSEGFVTDLKYEFPDLFQGKERIQP